MTKKNTILLVGEIMMMYHCEFHNGKRSISKKIMPFVPQIQSNVVLEDDIYKVISVTYEIDTMDSENIAVFVVVSADQKKGVKK